MDTQRYPLAWPTGWKRTPAHLRKRAQFGVVSHNPVGYKSRRALTVWEAVQRLSAELRRLGANGEVLSTNVETRLDGIPRSDRAAPKDPGAAVYFRLDAKPLSLASDRWDRVADNIAALAMHIEALRAIDRYGVGTREQSFAGYTALPAATASGWRTILGVTDPTTLDDVEACYRELARTHHPDVGGTQDTMARLNAAREAARAELGARR